MITQSQSFRQDGFEILADDNGRFLQFADSTRLEDLDEDLGCVTRGPSLKIYLQGYGHEEGGL